MYKAKEEEKKTQRKYMRSKAYAIIHIFSPEFVFPYTIFMCSLQCYVMLSAAHQTARPKHPVFMDHKYLR